jgi:hypothetical protein
MPNPFHAGHKLAWLEQVANDRRTSDFQVRVSIAVSRRADRTGIAAAGQEGLARFIGASDRGVRNALRDLVQFNHLQRENGGASGRGVVGQYRLVLPSVGLGDESRNDEARNDDVDLSHSRNGQGATPEADTRKLGNVVPPLPYSSIDLPEPSLSADELATDWKAIKAMATKRFGVDLVKSWLSDLELAGIDGEVGIILAPNRFVADRVFAQFGDHLQQWWMRQRSNVRLVRLVTRA